MKYDGIIDQEIKDSAKEVLALPDEGQETRTLCIETIGKIQTALMEKRQPFFDKVDEIVVKYDINNSEFDLFQARRELNDISLTLDVEAERLVHALMEKYRRNK